MVHIYNGVLVSHKKSKIMVFIATWMELEIIILRKIINSELSQKREIP